MIINPLLYQSDVPLSAGFYRIKGERDDLGREKANLLLVDSLKERCESFLSLRNAFVSDAGRKRQTMITTIDCLHEDYLQV